MAEKPTTNYIPALTGVRAFAAYLVFVSHYAYAFDGAYPHWLQRFLSEMHIGVTIFFVLSGFLIAFRYFDSFELSGIWFRKYLKNRVARIYPMYFLLTLGAFVAVYFTHDQKTTGGYNHPVALFLLNISFLRGFFDQLKFTGIAQGWSLTVEECFYFSAPFIFFFARRYKKFYLQPVLITGFGCLLVFVFIRLSWYGFFVNFTFMMLYTFLGRCFEFFAGIQLALIVRNKNFDNNSRKHYTGLGFILIFVCVYLLSVLKIPKGEVAGLHNPSGIFTNNYLLAITIALFFYGLITENSLLKKILSNKFTELLGKSSYIFYLIHLGYISDFIHFGLNGLNDYTFELYDKWGVDWHSPFEYDALNILYAFLLLNALSILLFKTVEEPLNYFIRKSGFLINNKPRDTSV